MRLLQHLRRLRTALMAYGNALYPVCFVVITMLTACYHQHPDTPDAMVQYSEEQLDSLSFSSTHHFTNNYNFVVKADSIHLLRQQPEELMSNLAMDTLTVYHHNHLVVADIRMIPNDTIDSVWVQVARDQETFGWIHESDLLPNVVPDDPVSQFISVFSDVHLLIFLIIICIIGCAYLMRKIMKMNARIVHFRDIDSFYPTLLCVIVASSATLYASIQMFAPEMWRHFYFNPTLNPFSVPTILSVFLMSVWAMLIVALAAVDEVRHRLPIGEAVLYLCGLMAVCAVNYIVFSITSLYYVGYLLLVAYVFYAVRRYLIYNRAHFVCGSCGAKMRHKGRCPRCGTLNS